MYVVGWHSLAIAAKPQFFGIVAAIVFGIYLVRNMLLYLVLCHGQSHRY
jgi:hypothetical protein